METQPSVYLALLLLLQVPLLPAVPGSAVLLGQRHQSHQFLSDHQWVRARVSHHQRASPHPQTKTSRSPRENQDQGQDDHRGKTPRWLWPLTSYCCCTEGGQRTNSIYSIGLSYFSAAVLTEFPFMFFFKPNRKKIATPLYTVFIHKYSIRS